MQKRMTDERFKELRAFIENRHGVFIPTEDVAGMELAEETQRARAGEAVLFEALKRIAFMPFGPSEATHEQVLDLITAFARDTLEKAGRR